MLPSSSRSFATVPASVDAAVLAGAWAIEPSALPDVLAQLRQATPTAGPRVVERRFDSLFAKVGPVAVIPINGPLMPRPTFFGELFGWTSAAECGAALAAALVDPAVKAIVFDVSSPGGSVQGIPELADQVLAARGRKPIVAVANHMAASAAYWVAACADAVFATPSSVTGAIGILTTHTDMSRLNEKLGLSYTIIAAGKFKTEGSETAPLAPEAQRAIQHQVNQYYTMFVDHVARGRRADAGAVRHGFGEGRALGAADALRAGLIDGVATLPEVLTRVARDVSGGQFLAGPAGRLERERRVAALEVECFGSAGRRASRDRERRVKLLERSL